MTRLNLFTLSLILFSMALFTTPTPGHAANKQIDAIGVVDCGQDTCTVVPLKKGSGQPLLYFVVRSAQGSKILKQAQACSFVSGSMSATRTPVSAMTVIHRSPPCISGC